MTLRYLYRKVLYLFLQCGWCGQLCCSDPQCMAFTQEWEAH